MNDSRFISRKLLIAIAIAWLGLPLVMFLIGWLRPIIGWPMAIGVIWASTRTISRLESSRKAIVYIDRKFWIMTVIVFLFTIFSGIGGFAYQGFWDHAFRNAVFNDLVNHSWPVVETGDDGVTELLCYYHAFWLPAAILVKFTGLIWIGYVMQLLYAFIGFMLVGIFVFDLIHVDRIKLWVIILIALFCGWDIVTFFFSWPDLAKTSSIEEIYMIGKDLPFVAMSAPGLSQISFFVYNQGIAAWIAFGLLYDQRSNIRCLLFPYSLLFLFAPIPTAGLLPAMTYWMCRHIRKAFTLENVIGGFIFIIVGLYFLANNRTEGFEAAFQSFGEYSWKTAVFILFSYVIYLPYIWKYIHKNVFFWILCATTIIVPYFSLNGERDLGCRIGMALAYCFMVLVIKSICEIRHWSRYKAVALIVTLIIGG